MYHFQRRVPPPWKLGTLPEAHQRNAPPLYAASGGNFNTTKIAEACRFSLDTLKYEYPQEITSDNRSPHEELTMLAWQGAEDFFGTPLPPKIVNSINHELRFIEEMNYASYFLGHITLASINIDAHPNLPQ